MNKPKNFSKIDGVMFKSGTGKEYIFATDGRSKEVWVFGQPDNTTYVLAFIMDWKTNTYEIKRAENGQGTNWIDIIHSGKYTVNVMKSMNEFIEWVKHRVTNFESFFNKK